MGKQKQLALVAGAGALSEEKVFSCPDAKPAFLQTLIFHDFFGSIQAFPRRLKYSEFSSDSRGSTALALLPFR